MAMTLEELERAFVLQGRELASLKISIKNLVSVSQLNAVTLVLQDNDESQKARLSSLETRVTTLETLIS